MAEPAGLPTLIVRQGAGRLDVSVHYGPLPGSYLGDPSIKAGIPIPIEDGQRPLDELKRMYLNNLIRRRA